MPKRRNLAGSEIQAYENDIDYALDRPEIWIGSVNEELGDIITLEPDGDIIVWNNVPFIPGLFKIINEVIDNAVDEAIRTTFQYANKISVTFKDERIVVHDNGRGIPQEKDEQTGKHVPELVFTELRVGSNFDDDSGIALIGRNGVGVSLTNIFSKELQVHTFSKGVAYQQKFLNNAKNVEKPQISKNVNRKPSTMVSFVPDYEYFGASDKVKQSLSKLIIKRLRDLALTYPEISFSYNDIDLSSNTLKKHFGKEENTFYKENTYVRLGVKRSPTSTFLPLAYVNGAATNSGTHVDYVMGKIIDYLRTYIKRKHKIEVKPLEIKNKFFLFLSMRIPNPTFSSQTKEILTTPPGQFSIWIDNLLTDQVLKKICNNEELINDIIEVYQLKAMKKAKDAVKKKRKVKIEELVEAQSRDKEKNILMICEGKSALTELVNVRGNNPHIAGMPIRGKFLNVYEKKISEVIKNQEIQNVMQAIGLEIGEPAENLNYGKIGLLTDQDYDGNAISGLLINFFYKYWPELFDENRIIRMLSPLFTVHQGTNEHIRFYNHTDFHKWKDEHKGEKWSVKYYKGLGSLGSKEYEIMLENPKYLTIQSSINSFGMIHLVYSSDTDARKGWLSEVK